MRKVDGRLANERLRSRRRKECVHHIHPKSQKIFIKDIPLFIRAPDALDQG